MKIEDVRSSFTVYIIASELNRLDGISESLGLAGYMCANFTQVTAAYSEIPSNPPHMVIFDGQESHFNLDEAIQQVARQLPESHIFVVSPIEDRDRNLTYLDRGAYDLIYTPVKSTTELLKKLDRAAERDYFMYMNERLLKEGAAASAAAPTADSSSGSDTLEFARRLFDQRSGDDCIQTYLKFCSARLKGGGVVFLKYIANRRVLLATQAHATEAVEWNGMGVNFNEAGEGFRAAHLRDPADIPELRAMVTDVFQTEEFFATPIEALGEIQGVVIFLKPEPPGEILAVIHDWTMLLGRALSLQEAERRLHVMTVKDSATDLLNRQNFTSRIIQEIARARRTESPVSLVLLAIDQYGAILSQVGPEEAQTVLRMAARIFERHSRINDVVGRTGADEFGILLPHTARAGALVKAERLRRIIESADFSRVLKNFPHMTISVGVAEYPSMVRDADELLQSADEALYQVRGEGNKTCVAKPPDGFVADFQVREKEKGL